MVIAPNTTIKFVNVPIEIDNKNQINFASKQAQLNYFNSIPNMITIEGCTYQRKDGYVRVPRSFDTMQTYNYCFYQNTSYSEKWFFAFVERIEFSSTDMCYVYIKTDVFQTYQFDIEFKKSFVVREHVNNDTPGLHTLPEGLELGDFIINSIDLDLNLPDLSYVICTNKKMDGETNRKATSLGGIWTPGYVYVTDDITVATNIIASYQANPEDIYAVYLAPTALFDSSQFTATLYNGNATPIYWGDNISKPTQLDGYTPVNKKLLTYPYSFLNVSNNSGVMQTYQYEYFSDSDCQFIIKGVPTIGCSIKLTPTHYKNNQNLIVEDEGIMGGKFPTCAWSQDYYTNWLTQNAVNVSTTYKKQAFSTLGNIAGSLISASTGNVALSSIFAMQGVSSATSLGGSVLENMKQQTLAEMHPNSVNGNINGGDINSADRCNTFYFYKMSIKAEFAKVIDDYFSMFGYTVNSLKVPNITGRTNWNYVKTIGCNIIGSLPESAVEELKNIFNGGVTIWHNPATFLDYSQSNSIIV